MPHLVVRRAIQRTADRPADHHARVAVLVNAAEAVVRADVVRGTAVHAVRVVADLPGLERMEKTAAVLSAID